MKNPETEQADLEFEARQRAEKYDRLLRLATFFDQCGEQMRGYSQLGESILRDDDVADTEALSPKTFSQAEEDIRLATTGKHSILSRSIELDADALVVRATVLTYRWIDELQEAAYKTLGAIAGRAIGYLAPEVALGGAIVSAGLIETDALDRDAVASYLNELAQNNPDLLDHVTSGGGGLLDGLAMRAVLTVGALSSDTADAAARGGLRAVGVSPFEVDLGSALRDVAGQFTRDQAPESGSAVAVAAEQPPVNVESLMQRLTSTTEPVQSIQVGPGRFICFLPGASAPQRGPAAGRMRVSSGDLADYLVAARAHLESIATEGQPARVMLVGAGLGALAALELATDPDERFVVEQVVTAGAPRSAALRVPPSVRILALEDRADPIALLGALIDGGAESMLTVVFDGTAPDGVNPYVVGGRAADTATHPDIRAELERLSSSGYLAS